jgi:hypothetical protein
MEALALGVNQQECDILLYVARKLKNKWTYAFSPPYAIIMCTEAYLL